MALIIRIDVDRPYGKQPRLRHVLSGLGSRLYFPAIEAFGYLKELEVILRLLNECRASSYVFFRRCTLPSRKVMQLLDDGGHQIGLHLEDSRSLESFLSEKRILEAHIGRPVISLTKHGSGREKYGFHHYPPYEPDKYIEWASQSGMRLFLGNLEDPSMLPIRGPADFQSFPSAFWLEPAWRDTARFTIDWLLSEARERDIVMLIHPENVLADANLTQEFGQIVHSVEHRMV